MSYDLELIQVPLDAEQSFPVTDSAAQSALKDAIEFHDLDAVRAILLRIKGCRSGPEAAIDYMGKGLNSARLFVRSEGIHVENNCGPQELQKIYNHLLRAFPMLLIRDLQSEQLHNAESFLAWWSKPL